MSLLQEMSKYGLADCEFNRSFFTPAQKYAAYCYRAKKQGFTILSFPAYLKCLKVGAFIEGDR